MAVSDDAFLGGRLRLLQPAKGVRSGSDAVLLAAAVPARSGDSALELGCAAGAASLCLLRRVEGVEATGLELQPELAALARDNAARNGLALDVVEGDVADPPAALKRRLFDHVLLNPPYFEPSRSSAAPDDSRRLARAEGEGGLDAWLACALSRARPGGSIVAIHRAERLPELLSLLADKAGGIVVFPLWPGPGQPAKRVILRAVKGSRAAVTLAPGLTLHEADGRYAAEAEASLRDGRPLAFP
jgi:tRNA1(Val) A37 N6-methylase TrmN6